MVEFINSHSSPYRGDDSSDSILYPRDGQSLITATTPLPTGPTVAQPSLVFSANEVNWRTAFIYADLVSSLLSLVGNILIAIAVVRTKFTLAGYRRFLLSLTAADILMASTYVLTFAHEKTAGRYYHWQLMETCGTNFLRNFTLVGYFASLLSIGGLTADNFLGIFKPLSYNALMAGGRLVRVIIGLWVLSFLLGFIDMPVATVSYLQNSDRKTPDNKATNPPSVNPISPANASSLLVGNSFYFGQSVMVTPATPTTTQQPSPKSQNNSKLSVTPTAGSYSDSQEEEIDMDGLIKDVLILIEKEQDSAPVDWCSYYSSNKFGVELFVIGITVPCFLLLLGIYGRIFLEVIRRRTSSQRKTYRLVLTTLLLIGSFTFCWMPFVLFELTMYLHAFSHAPKQGEGDTKMNSESKQAMVVNTVFNSLLMLSPLVNPIIYSSRLRRVRYQLLAILSCNSKKWAAKFSSKERGCGSKQGLPPRSCNVSNYDCSTGADHQHSSLRITRSTNSTSLWASSTMSPPDTPHKFLSPSSTFLMPAFAFNVNSGPHSGSNGNLSAIPSTNSSTRNSNSSIKCQMISRGMTASGSAVFAGSAEVAALKPDFRCHIRGCDALFLSQAAFFRHVTSKHGNDVNLCDRCFEPYYRDQGHSCLVPRDSVNSDDEPKEKQPEKELLTSSTGHSMNGTNNGPPPKCETVSGRRISLAKIKSLFSDESGSKNQQQKKSSPQRRQSSVLAENWNSAKNSRTSRRLTVDGVAMLSSLAEEDFMDDSSDSSSL